MDTYRVAMGISCIAILVIELFILLEDFDLFISLNALIISIFAFLRTY